jgi:hypothetical protein
MERSPALALGQRAVGLPRAPLSRRNVGRDDGVELPIVALDPCKIVLEQLVATGLAPTDERG